LVQKAVRRSDRYLGEVVVRVKRFLLATVVSLVVSSAIVPTTLNAAASTTASRFTPEAFVHVGPSPTVYVEGTVKCGHSACPRLLRTDNNGATLVDVSAPPTPIAKNPLQQSWDQIVFANARVGFALEVKVNGKGIDTGSVLFATRDGARSWKKVREPAGDFLSSIATGTNTLYGVTTKCSKQPDGNEGCLDYRLVHTSLEMSRWSSTPIPNGRSYPWGFLGNVAAYGPMVWTTEGAKWSLLVSSNDHGASLRAFTPKFPALASVAGCDLTAFSTTALWAECPTGMEVSFFFSGDGGVKWTTVPTRQFMGTGGGFFDPVSTTLAFVDYGGSLPLYRVSDAGRDMVVAGTLRCSKINSSVNAMAFTNARDGLAICLPQDLFSLARVERTTDGGATWSRIKL
jgi:hypothetical protein